MEESGRDRRTLDRAEHLLGSPLMFTTALTGGEHALTLLAKTPTGVQVVVRRFPPGDPAGGRETSAAPYLSALDRLVPELIASDIDDDEGSILVTEYVEGESCPHVDDGCQRRAKTEQISTAEN